MFKFLMLAALMVFGAVPSEPPLPVHVGGRVAQDGAALRFGWPGVYFEGRFRGTGVMVAVESGTEHLRILIDGHEKALLTRPGVSRLSFERLAPGEHVVRLEKMTESQSGGGRFLGFWPTDGTPLPVKARAKRIEFIGDSHTVGYGDTSPVRECDEAGVHDTTDSTLAFGPLLAKRIDADYRLIAYSGYGIVRNYAGKVPGESLPFIYSRAIPGEAAPAADDGWKPQLIVIYLGTNDFSTPVKAGEAWADEAALRAAWRTRYVAFVGDLRKRQPQARFVLMGADNFLADLRQVATAAGGLPVLRVPPMEMTGCHWHPSLKDHRGLADLLEGEIGRMPELWD